MNVTYYGIWSFFAFYNFVDEVHYLRTQTFVSNPKKWTFPRYLKIQTANLIWDIWVMNHLSEVKTKCNISFQQVYFDVVVIKI